VEDCDSGIGHPWTSRELAWIILTACAGNASVVVYFVREISREIEQAVIEVQRLVDARFAAAAGSIRPGSPMDQAGLEDGADNVRDYLGHGEWEIAFDHLMYMITALDLESELSARTLEVVTRLQHLSGR
jgi:hypothetical protein